MTFFSLPIELRMLAPVCVWFASGLISLTSCSTSSREAPALRNYVQDPGHGLTHHIETGPVSVTCTYRPTDLLIAQELARNANSVPLDSLRRTYAGKTYFALTLAQNEVEIEDRYLPDNAAFTQALSYLSTGIAADVFIVTATRDSVAALAAIYPRQYGTTGRSTVLLVFDSQKLDLQQGFTFTFHDRFFNLGTLRFPFAADDLQALPQLKL